MAHFDTNDDSPNAGSPQFSTTHWSVVLAAGDSAVPGADEALEKLCRTYWYPLYAYARRQGHSPPDGQDLTQQFFAVFLEKKHFGSADPARGRFRCFLLASFKNFLANEHHRSYTAKRGGGFAFVSLDETDTEAHYRNEMAAETSPDELFDRVWAFTLLEKVMKALQQEHAGAGKGALFDALQVFLTGGNSEATYEEVGAGLGLSESAVKMAVSRLRRRYGEMLRAEIAHTVADPSVVDDELRLLATMLGR